MITICMAIWCNTIYFADAIEIRAGSLGTDYFHSTSLFCISSGMTQQLAVGGIMPTSSKHCLLSDCPAGTTTIYDFSHGIGMLLSSKRTGIPKLILKKVEWTYLTFHDISLFDVTVLIVLITKLARVQGKE